MKICSIEDCDRKVYAKGWCALHYQRWFRHGDPHHRVLFEKNLTCSVEGCNLRATGKGMCQRHYVRWKKYGTPISPIKEWGQGHIDKKGYLFIHRKNHPIAYRDGKIAVHRMVLFDKIGPGEHNCNWCSKSVSWNDGSLHVDHLDWDKLNNNPDNLVPSCPSCNSKRKKDKEFL